MTKRCAAAPGSEPVAGPPPGRAVWFAAWLLLGGCAALAPQLESPHLEVISVRFIAGDLAHQQIGLKLHVRNPNPRALAVQRIDYGIELAGSEFARGTTAAPFTLPAAGATDLDLTLTADMLAALKVLGTHLGERDIAYRVTGTVHFAHGVLRVLPFSSGGSLALR